MHTATLTGQPKGRILAVMVVWNGLDFLQDAIDSVLRELGDDNGLLVVDNSSTDGSYEYVLEHFPQVAVLQTHDNLGGAGGFSAGMQVALELEECEYVWLLDNDILAESGALPPLLNCLQEHPGAAAAGSQLCLYREPELIQAVGARYTHWLGDIQGNLFRQDRLVGAEPVETDYLAACSLLVRKQALAQVGRFADLFIFFDDVDWCLRAKKQGFSLWVVPESVIRHNFGGEKALVPWREYYRKRNKLYCLAAHPPEKSRMLGLLIYLCFLNYLIQYYRLAGDSIYAMIYSSALNDFLQANLGKKDLSGFTLTQPFPDGVKPWRHNMARILGLLAGTAIGFIDTLRYLAAGNRGNVGELYFNVVTSTSQAPQ